MNHAYHNCLPESSHLENPNGWELECSVPYACAFRKSFSEQIIHISKFLSSLTAE